MTATTTHALSPRSDKTACRTFAFDFLGRPIPEVLLDPSCPSCPVCHGFVRVHAWIKHEQKHLMRLGRSGEDALVDAVRQLSDEDHAAWLCESVEAFRANRDFRRELVRLAAAREAAQADGGATRDLEGGAR